MSEDVVIVNLVPKCDSVSIKHILQHLSQKACILMNMKKMFFVKILLLLILHIKNTHVL